jgi:hypothetical protein
MPNHYHLLIHVHSLTLRTYAALALSYSKAINKRYGRSGSLFEGRFQATRVDREEYLLHLSRYVHTNPVTARLVSRPEDWEFSSYRDYIGVRAGILPKPDIVLAQFASPDAYRIFVEAYTEADRCVIQSLTLE